MKTYTKMLPVKLSDEELNVRASELAQLLLDQKAIEDERKAVMDQFKSRLEETRKQLDILVKIISTRTEPKEVDCMDRLNMVRKTVETHRMDTGEIIASRVMTSEDQQQALSFINADDSSTAYGGTHGDT